MCRVELLQVTGGGGVFVSRPGLSRDVRHVDVDGWGVLLLLEATHCLSRDLLLSCFLLLDDCVILPPFICCTTFRLPLVTFLTISKFFGPFLVVIFTRIQIRHFDW